MTSVAKNKLYAPTYDVVRLAPWRRKYPSRDEVIRELIKVTNRKKTKPLGIVKGKKEPDIKWMLNVIATLKNDHYFFAKGYYPEKVKHEDSEQSEEVDDAFPKDFFDDLPISNKR